jgi:uncharacterized membrane protein YjgN (DUF898 family)
MFIACPDSGRGTALFRAKKLRCDSGSSLVGALGNRGFLMAPCKNKDAARSRSWSNQNKGDPMSGFRFTGGAATYLGTALLGGLITLLTLGICYPFALVLTERWKAKHSTIDGRPIVFTGTGLGLFGLWIKWLLLSIITVGIYLFWVGPQIQKWKWEHLAFAN